MSRKNKKNKKPVQTQQGGYKRFLTDLYELLSDKKVEAIFLTFSNDIKRRMYGEYAKISNPVAGNENVSSKEIKNIIKITKKLYRDKNIEFEDRMFSTHCLHLFECYIWAVYKQILKEEGDENHPDVIEFKNNSDETLKIFTRNFVHDHLRIATRLSSPDYKYFGVRIRMSNMCIGDTRKEIITEIHGFSPRKYMFDVKGNKRPAFRLGKAVGNDIFEWISVDTSLLGDFYNGEEKEIEVYIQSHALRRIKERLDLLDKKAINYTLWFNSNQFENFEIYKEYLLLPYKVFDVKIGYLAANIIDDKLLFRTFLFITHNSTPEGDQLKELTGLGKHDISYWKIDRLSTYVNLDEEKHPELISFFKEAGLEELIQLKDKEFDIDKMQDDNFDGLIEYLNKSKESNRLVDTEELSLV